MLSSFELSAVVPSDWYSWPIRHARAGWHCSTGGTDKCVQVTWCHSTCRQHNQYEHRLAAVELAVKQHEERLRVLDQKAETAARESNKLSLVLYGVSEEFKDKLDEADIASSSKPRPLLIKFASDEEKHGLFKYTKTLRQAGIRCDDFLTRQQQQGRQVLSEDFLALEAKGHTPFLRGSELKYYYADKTHTCKQSQAQKAPAAKS